MFPKLCTVPDLGRPGRRYPPRHTTRDDSELEGEWLNRREPWPGPKELASEPPGGSDAVPFHPAATVTQDACHASGDRSDAAEPPMGLPVMHEGLPDPAESDEDSKVSVSGSGDTTPEASGPAPISSALPGTQRASTPQPIHPAVQPPKPSYAQRVVAFIAGMFGGGSNPPPSSEPSAMSGTPD